MTRRDFFKFLTYFAGSTAVVSCTYPLARFIAPLKGKTRDEKVTLRKSELSVGEGKEVLVGNIPAIVVNVKGMGYVAFSKVCTHLGCLVEYNRDQNKFVCPCHAGTFSIEGNVLSGPPPRSLDKLPLSVEGENIIIG